MRIGFHGAAGEVTGSCTLVEIGHGHDLVRFIVDCGMFQGGPEARSKNLRALNLGFDVRHLDFVLLTHAHIDHSGLLPRLAVMGYRGPVYTTPATVDLLGVLLPDSAHIQEKESEWQLRHQRRTRKTERIVQAPLYTVAQANAVLGQLRAVPYGERFKPARGIEASFHDAGHILGSAWIDVGVHEGGKSRRLVFSGDLGMPGRPILRDPQPVSGKTDLLFVESTYGNRLHRSLPETEDEIIAAIERVRSTRGNLIVPSFAVGRTQEIIYVLADLVRRNRLPALKVFVDSPMANAATRITLAHPEILDGETRDLIAWQAAHPERMHVQFIADVEDSKALNAVREGAIIISASGMCEAGRIKYHLRENLPRSECGVLIAGFQAAGTLGRRLVDGARLVRIFGQQLPVRAHIHTVGGLSAHADQGALLNWLRGFAAAPGETFLIHGEPAASAALSEAITQTLSWSRIHRPELGSSIAL